MEYFQGIELLFEPRGACQSRPLQEVATGSFLVRHTALAGILLVLLSAVAHAQKGRSRQDPWVTEAAELTAKGGEENLSRAFRLYEEAANAGNADAMNDTGKCYFQGNGIAKDEKQGLRWFERGASAGSTKATNNLKKSAQLFQKAAKSGDVPSMQNLGYCFAKGLGVPTNGNAAVYWWEKAANAGDTVAMYNLGYLYQGKVINFFDDAKKAAAWYEKAANAGYAPAMSNLGELYVEGSGVTRDYVKAFVLFEKAIGAGDVGAMTNLGNLYAEGSGVTKDYRKAAEWYEKAANAGNAPAMSNLGGLYEQGSGVNKDSRKAGDWYEKAATAGNSIAMYNLGWYYAKGEGIPRNETLALQWMEKSLKAGYAPARSAIYEIKYPGAAAASEAANLTANADRLRRQQEFDRKFEAADPRIKQQMTGRRP